jgi:O-antigen ligase
MAIFAFIFVFLKKEKWLVWEKIIYPFSFFILLTGLALTFSRTIILAGSAAILAWLLYLYVKKIDRKKIFAVFLLFAISYMLLAILLWPLVTNRFAPSALEGQAYDLRVFYSHKALEFLDQDPLLGVGIGNFVPYSMQKEKLAEAWMYQPAHNLYLLIAAEIGILGSMVFLILLFLILIGFYRFALKNPAFLGIFLLAVSYALLANTDHFFWTLQQGGLMFWSVLGIMSGAGKSPEPR